MLAQFQVLILALVEHTLRGLRRERRQRFFRSLNPCFSGTYSQRPAEAGKGGEDNCLNPCSSGTYSQRLAKNGTREISPVLILVLVEHTLRGSFKLCKAGHDTS